MPLLYNAQGLPLNARPTADASLDGVSLDPPAKLQQFFTFNPHLLNKYLESVQQAVQYSFQHEDTKMRNITSREIRARLALCAEITTEGYFDEKMPMIRILDLLPDILVDCLRMSYGIVDTAVKQQEQGRANSYSVNAPAEDMVVINDDVNAD